MGNGFSYRFGRQQLNLHGPGVDAQPLAHVPVAPGGSDLCFAWDGPIDAAVEHLERCEVPVELGPVRRFGAARRGQVGVLPRSRRQPARVHLLRVIAVIFDCDGTLVDSEPLAGRAWALALARHGYELARRRSGGRPRPAVRSRARTLRRAHAAAGRRGVLARLRRRELMPLLDSELEPSRTRSRPHASCARAASRSRSRRRAGGRGSIARSRAPASPGCSRSRSPATRSSAASPRRTCSLRRRAPRRRRGRVRGDRGQRARRRRRAGGRDGDARRPARRRRRGRAGRRAPDRAGTHHGGGAGAFTSVSRQHAGVLLARERVALVGGERGEVDRRLGVGRQHDERLARRHAREAPDVP